MGHPIAIIGAGISGLACARALADAGHPVVIFEKSRGPGGRMSTRRTESGVAFDHGAQYFTARDPDFRAATSAWLATGAVAEWNPRITVIPPGSTPRFIPPLGKPGTPESRLVGVPGMNSPLKTLALGLDCRYGVQIASVNHTPTGLMLTDTAGTVHGPFAALVCSAPAPQTAALLASAAPDIARRAAAARMAPCWAVMAEFDAPLPVPFDAAFINQGPLGWIARDSSKPARTATETWVIHATHEWSAAHLEYDPAQAQSAILAEFTRLLTANVNATIPAPASATAHRWRYAIAAEPLGTPFLHSAQSPHPITACGDWCLGPRIEDAHASGLAAANHLIHSFQSAN